MQGTVFSSRFMPCPDCGESIDVAVTDSHRCARKREVDYQMFRLRGEVDSFEDRLQNYLRTSAGRFEMWLAARRVRDSAR